MRKDNKFNTYCFPEIKSTTTPGKDARGRSQNEPQTLEQRVVAAETGAFEEAFAEGRNSSLDNEKEKVRPLNDLVSKADGMFRRHQRETKDLCHQDTARIALALARDILDYEIAKSPELASSIIRQALEKAIGQDNIKIKANPDDCEAISAMLSQMVPDADRLRRIQISEDQSILTGGCLIETDFGVIDARIDNQLRAIGEKLDQAVHQSATSFDGAPGGEQSTEDFEHLVQSVSPIKSYGHVTQVVGLVVEANGPMVQMGTICDIYGTETSQPVAAEVLGFRDKTVLMMPLEEIRAIGPGSRVVARDGKASISVGANLFGRVIDGLGNPIDGKGPLRTTIEYPIYANPINPLLRQRIRTPLDLGIRAINGLLTVGCGQRMGIFAGSGVGKSVLMGMIARNSRADVNVIALIGERGRELNDFIEKDLGEEGLKRSVVIVATSDHLPLVRVRGAFVATAIAEFFRDQGMTVNLMMDSLTRFAMAQREIGLALGEPPTTKGYTPSVFTLLPKLLERAGTSDHDGSITGLYTVLVEGDDMNEPIADAARSILDGHIVLRRELAHQNHYPAIDVLGSISRVMQDIAALQHKHNAGRFKELLATYRKSEDLINIGAYVNGSNPAIDRAIAKIDQINGYLRQGIGESVDFETSLQQLEQVMNTP